MFRARLNFSILATIAVLVAGAAHAADYIPPAPPQPYIPPPPPQPCCDSWYLRGYVGIGLNNNSNVEYLPAPANVGNGFNFEHNDIADTPFIGLGVGYEVNNWLRIDATAEYRSKTEVTAFGSYTFDGGVFGDSYHGYLKSWVFLANAYVDLGTWNCFTPFIGAGIGGAYNTMSDLTDIGIFTSGRGIGRDSSDWHMAWALYAGVAYNVSQSLKIELTYRYLNYGSVTDTIDCLGNGCGGGATPQVRQLQLQRLHARPALDLLRLRAARAVAVRLYAAARIRSAADLRAAAVVYAAAAEPRLARRARGRS